MIYFADFETSTTLINGKVNTYLWGLVSEDNVVREYGIDMASFFDTIKYLEKNPIIYFHNISWDGAFIVHYLIDSGYNFVEKLDSKTKNNSFTWIADYNTNIYTLKVKNKYGTITFLDSLKILASSVEKLGKAIDMNKLEIDYNSYTKFNSKSEVPKELVEYLFRDIDIVKVFMEKFSKKVDKVKTTLASTMYAQFQKFYGINNFINDFGSPHYTSNILTRDEWIKIKESYNGGFTAISPRYVGVDIKDIDGYSYDWNSMYPSVMLNYKMPYGRPRNTRLNDDDLELMEIRIIKAVKTDDLLPAMLPNNSFSAYVGKYLDECSDMTIYVWRDEWEEIIKGYSIDYIHSSSMFFSAKYVFREFINKIKEEKINAKTPVDRLISKLMQNALYGKFGQSIERVSKVLEHNPDMSVKGKRYGDKQEWVEVKKITELKTLPYIPIASYITSMSRTLLFRAIHSNRKTFIYCDTDSLYLTGEGVGLKIDDKEYGCLKMEHRFDRFKALKLKCYMLNDINTGLNVKVAGLPLDAQSLLNFDNFYRGYVLDKSKLQKKHHVGGLILEDVDYTL